jgi:iron complex transport system ATP-binding protein
MLLSANSLSLSYNGHNVVEGFNLSIAPKTIVGLIGPNGSGKTTILRALAGLMEPRAGTALVQGHHAARLNKQIRARKIGWVPQQESAAWPLTVSEVVRLGRAPHRGWLMPFTKDDLDIVECALARADLLELKHRPVNKLSGGEFQRVLIARVLAQEPEALLLDEPTASLDVHHQVQVLDLVRGLVNEKGLSVVMAIHDLNLAARYCDQLVLLHNGRQVSVGTPEEVLTAENLRAVFHVEAKLYRDPWGAWAVSMRQNNPLRIPTSPDVGVC